jgi:ATP-dependent RNA helicase DDX3X
VDDDPFKANEKEDHDADQMFQEENTGIDFDAYEDIPVSTSGRDVPDAVDSFTDIGLPDGLLKNVQVCAPDLCSMVHPFHLRSALRCTACTNLHG